MVLYMGLKTNLLMGASRFMKMSICKVINPALAGLLACLAVKAPANSIPGRSDRSQITFAYLQGGNSTDIRGMRWGAITHIGWSFITFNASAALSGVTTFNARSAELK